MSFKRPNDRPQTPLLNDSHDMELTIAAALSMVLWNELANYSSLFHLILEKSTEQNTHPAAYHNGFGST